MADDAHAHIKPLAPGEKLALPAFEIEFGDSGLKALGGYVQEEFLRQLSGSQARRVYREMADNDSTVGAILEVFKATIGQVEWSVTAADDTKPAGEAKEFAEELIKDMDTPLTDVISEACTMFEQGFAPMEKTYKLRKGEIPQGREGTTSKFDDGKIGISEIALRAQNTIVRWDIVRGRIRGLWQMSTWKGGTVYIPIEKIALFRTTNVKNNPEGKSVLRRSYRAWWFKKNMEEIEAIGVERDLAGLPVLRIPSRFLAPDASPDEKAFATACKRMVTQLRREAKEGVVLSSDVYTNDVDGKATSVPLMELSLLNSGGARTFDTNAIIGRYDRAMAMSVLMDFMFLGQGSSGSWALSSDKTSLSATAVGSYLKRIAEVLNFQVLEPVMKMNGYKANVMPSLTPGDLEKPDLAVVGAFIQAMTAAGVPLFPDRELENSLRKMAGLPLAPEDGLEDQGAPGDEEWSVAPPARKKEAA